MLKNLDILNALSLSIKILFRNPLLLLPKLIVAILYGFGLLFSMSLAKKILPLLSFSLSSFSGINFSNIFFDAVLLVLISGVAFFLDIIFSGLYPVLVEQATVGKVSFEVAFSSIKKKLKLILFSGIFAWVIVGIVSAVLSFILLLLKLSAISWVISFGIAFAFIFIFYFLFPTVIFKDDTVNSSFRDTVKESFSNIKIVLLFSLIPFVVSVVKFVVAFYAVDSSSLIFYWVLVFVTAFVYSIHAIINQILFSRLYLHNVKK